jgi:hypothetical protein
MHPVLLCLRSLKGRQNDLCVFGHTLSYFYRLWALIIGTSLNSVN